MLPRKLLEKKSLGCIFIALFFLLIAFLLLSHFHSGKWPWEMLQYSPLTEDEIQERIPTFSRNYPDVIKGNWEPNPSYMEKMLMSDSDRLKDMGVNTVSVAAEYELDKYGAPFMREEEIRRSNLARAKEEGFAVWIGVSFVGRFGSLGSDVTLDDYLSTSEEVALKWAKIAEEFNVEYFDPQAELDFIINENFTDDPTEKAQIVADWYEGMLPKIKEVYNGRVLAKFAWAEEEMIITGSQYTGYDYVAIALSHKFEGLVKYRDVLKLQYSYISELAEEGNCEWIIGEAFYNYFSLFFPIPISYSGEWLNSAQDDYFRTSTEEYQKFEGYEPAGYIFHSWGMPGTKVKGRPAEGVLSDFFHEI